MDVTARVNGILLQGAILWGDCFSPSRLIYDPATGKPRGFGFCEYEDAETAMSAVRNLAGREVCGRPLRIDSAANAPSAGGPGPGGPGVNAEMFRGPGPGAGPGLGAKPAPVEVCLG